MLVATEGAELLVLDPRKLLNLLVSLLGPDVDLLNFSDVDVDAAGGVLLDPLRKLIRLSLFNMLPGLKSFISTSPLDWLAFCAASACFRVVSRSASVGMAVC